MPLQGFTLGPLLSAIGLAWNMAYPSAVAGQYAQTLSTQQVVSLPTCTNNRGETVRFVESKRSHFSSLWA